MISPNELHSITELIILRKENAMLKARIRELEYAVNETDEENAERLNDMYKRKELETWGG